MSSGIHHQRFSLGAATPAALLTQTEAGTPQALMLWCGFVFSLWCHPDRDQDAHADLFWWVYAKAFRHRGISHWPLVGTLTRLIYVGLWLVPVWGIVELLMAAGVVEVREWSLPPEFLELGLWFLYGLTASDIGHWLLDTPFFSRREHGRDDRRSDRGPAVRRV